MDFSNPVSNDGKVCVDCAEENKQRDVDEKIIAEAGLQLQEELFDQTAVLKYLLLILALHCDPDAGYQNVFCKQKKRIVEDENPKVGSEVNQDVQETGNDALRRWEFIHQAGSLHMEEKLPDKLSANWEDVHETSSQRWTCIGQLLVQIHKLFRQH